MGSVGHLTIFVQHRRRHMQSSSSEAKPIKLSSQLVAEESGPVLSVGRRLLFGLYAAVSGTFMCPLSLGRGNGLSSPATHSRYLALPKFGWTLSPCHLLVRLQ